MKIGVTGSNGTLGHELVSLGCIPITSDITEADKLREEISASGFDVIIHCEENNDIEWCEDNPSDAMKINYGGIKNLCNSFYKKIYYISCDQVFNGKWGNYFEWQKPFPTTVYGMTKWGGELLLSPNDVIIRTSLIFGSYDKSDFVSRIIVDMEKEEWIGASKKQYASPISAYALAFSIIRFIKFKKQPHIINISGNSFISGHDFAHLIADVWGFSKKQIQNETSLRSFRGGLRNWKAKSLGIKFPSLRLDLENMMYNIL